MKDASTALGAYPWRTTLSVIYPAARSGILTGLLLAIARISGETAPLLFTALNNQFWSTQPECADGESAGGDLSSSRRARIRTGSSWPGPARC